jgi:DNA polymerase elongation subunit (family B)
MLEFEKSYEAIIYPENKKSYINIDKKGTLITKGLSYNKYSL